MKKIVLLDIDGVLNTERHHSLCVTEGKALADQFGHAFDPVAVENLATIIAVTGADIVIASPWSFWGLKKMQKMWESRRLPGILTGVAPNRMSDEMLLNVDFDDWTAMAGKGHEIKEWMQTKGENVSNYVILDDVNDFLPEQQDHFVKISPETGITEEDAAVIIALLNR